MPNRKRTVVPMADTWESGVSGKTLDEAFEQLAQLDTVVQQAEDAASRAEGYADSIDPTDIARAVSYIITAPTTGWEEGSLTWGGATYTRRCTVTAAQATASPTSVLMEYAGGDYASYCAIQLLDTQDGSVVLWAAEDPAKSCEIKITEVRAGEGG